MTKYEEHVELSGETGRKIEIAPGLMVLRRDVVLTAMRSSGPGGQNVNKRSTKVRLSIAISIIRELIGEAASKRLVALAGSGGVTDDGRLVIVCDEKRSQIGNRKRCFERLRTLLIEARKRPVVRRRTCPTMGSIERRLEDKKHRARVKAQRQKPLNDA